MSTLVADVAVVGAGPAGVAAALAAADLGAQVVLVDAGQAVGGQIYRQPATAAAAGVTAVGPKMPRRLDRVVGHPRIKHLPGTVVWQAVSRAGGAGGVEFRLWLTSASGRTEAGRSEAEHVVARAVVVASGASEVVLPFPGWELPGVTTVGAAQALLKGQGVVAGRRVLVAGSGPLLLPAAAGLAEAGVEVVAVLEANPVTLGTVARGARLAGFTKKVGEAAGYARILGQKRVPVRAGYAVTECSGDGQVERAVVSRVDRDWRVVPGSGRSLAVDAVHVSFGFSPALELPRLLGCAELAQPGRPSAKVWCDADQATSQAGVFAAGETTGVAGAEVAELEGYLGGVSAVRYLRKTRPEVSLFNMDGEGLRAGSGEQDGQEVRAVQRVRAALVRARRFADGLDALYPWRDGWLEWARPETILCRCEEVAWGAIEAAVADGARDVRAVKGVTRCGMGYCQGRVCGPALQQAVAAATRQGLSGVGDLGSRPVMAPVSLGTIAGSA